MDRNGVWCVWEGRGTICGVCVCVSGGLCGVCVYPIQVNTTASMQTLRVTVNVTVTVTVNQCNHHCNRHRHRTQALVPGVQSDDEGEDCVVSSLGQWLRTKGAGKS